ncbi:MAG TPA: phosphosulfolactate synthase [Acidimicrobiales bacterium]|jgi:phosphosulfolactate synthase|nr:phosphosulfolactate synthase [Acidimicrobiales bacterium]
MVAPRFLELPRRPPKPRAAGRTFVLDTGIPVPEMEARLDTCGAYIDLWKFGWGTAYLDPGLEAKLALLSEFHVEGCTGGTLLEVAWSQDRVGEFLAWAEEVGFPCVEVSRGAVPMPLDEKRELIRLMSASFTVVAEVGAKDPAAQPSRTAWAEEVAGDLESGASCVLLEGRDSGTVGLYRPDGSVRIDLVDAVVRSVTVDRLVFEAPRKNQQAWFINHFGSDVNLANVAISDALGTEALRLGLRADTVDLNPASPRHRTLAYP